MNDDDKLVRARSGLSLVVPTEWVVADALEAHSPEGLVVSVTSYPIGTGTDAETLVDGDGVAGAEPVGSPVATRLLDGVQGLTQRFESIENGSGGFTQLATYAVDGARAIVARARCPKDRFVELEAEMRALLSSIGVDKPTPPSVLDTTDAGAEQATMVDRFAAGEWGLAQLEVVSGAALDLDRLCVIWGDDDTAGDFDASTGTWMLLSVAELHALARHVGQAAFPGIAPLAGDSTAETAAIRAARSVLLARGIVQSSGPDELTLSDRVARALEVVFRAGLVVQVLRTRPGSAGRTAYFVGPEQSVRVTTRPGGVCECVEMPTEQVFGDLTRVIATTVAEPDPSAPPNIDLTSSGGPPPPLGPPSRGAAVQIAVAGDDTVTVEDLAWMTIDHAGTFLHQVDASWALVAPRELRQTLLDAVRA